MVCLRLLHPVLRAVCTLSPPPRRKPTPSVRALWPRQSANNFRTCPGICPGTALRPGGACSGRIPVTLNAPVPGRECDRFRQPGDPGTRMRPWRCACSAPHAIRTTLTLDCPFGQGPSGGWGCHGTGTGIVSLADGTISSAMCNDPVSVRYKRAAHSGIYPGKIRAAARHCRLETCRVSWERRPPGIRCDRFVPVRPGTGKSPPGSNGRRRSEAR